MCKRQSWHIIMLALAFDTVCCTAVMPGMSVKLAHVRVPGLFLDHESHRSYFFLKLLNHHMWVEMCLQSCWEHVKHDVKDGQLIWMCVCACIQSMYACMQLIDLTHLRRLHAKEGASSALLGAVLSIMQLHAALKVLFHLHEVWWYHSDPIGRHVHHLIKQLTSSCTLKAL